MNAFQPQARRPVKVLSSAGQDGGGGSSLHAATSHWRGPATGQVAEDAGFVAFPAIPSVGLPKGGRQSQTFPSELSGEPSAAGKSMTASAKAAPSPTPMRRMTFMRSSRRYVTAPSRHPCDGYPSAAPADRRSPMCPACAVRPDWYRSSPCHQAAWPQQDAARLPGPSAPATHRASRPGPAAEDALRGGPHGRRMAGEGHLLHIKQSCHNLFT